MVGLLFGLVDGAAAAAALYAVRGAAPNEFGWFAYAPLKENVVYDYYGFSWEYVVVPAVLLAVNALLLPLVERVQPPRVGIAPRTEPAFTFCRSCLRSRVLRPGATSGGSCSPTQHPQGSKGPAAHRAAPQGRVAACVYL